MKYAQVLNKTCAYTNVVRKLFIATRQMKFQTKTFDLGNPTVILWLAITASLTIMGIVLLTNLKPDYLGWTILLATPMTMAFPLTLTYLLTSKVQFDNDRAVKSSIFGTTELKLANIKSFGVFAQSRFNCWLVDSETATENSLFDTNFISISEADNFDLGQRRPKRNIRLLFGRDIYNKVRDWIKTE